MAEGTGGTTLVRMSGSGATCFALFDSEWERDAAASICPPTGGIWRLSAIGAPSCLPAATPDPHCRPSDACRRRPAIEAGTPATELMERAGRALAEAVRLYVGHASR